MRRLLVLAVVCALALPATAAARGRLDPSFGSGGRMAWPVSFDASGYAFPGKAAGSPDGRIFVVADGSTILAFRPDGKLDVGFGAGGAVNPFLPVDLAPGSADIAVDHQGRVLVIAAVRPQEEPDPQAEYLPEPVPEPRQAILVTRYTPAGQPDPSFGNGGRVVTTLGFAPPLVPPDPLFGPGPPRRPRVAPSGIAIDAAGRIVLSGTQLAGYEVCHSDGAHRSQRVSFLARLTDAGQPDPSFGHNGVVTLREGPVGAPVADESGGVLASVGTPIPCETSRRSAAGYLFHVDGSGAPVASFGQGGWRPIPEDPHVKILPDGRGGLILMPTSPLWRRTLILRRMRADGSWDRRFGRGSVAEPFPVPRGTLVFSDAAIDPSGGVFVTGSWTRKTRGQGAKRRFLLFRLTSRGQLDRRYGILRTGFGRDTVAFSRLLLITPDGKPLAIGPVGPPVASFDAIAMARYTPAAG